MIEEVTVQCPYCGESFTALVDSSAGDQQYVEDCYVCCQPINFTVHVDMSGNLADVTVEQDNA